jgi:SAM-dependent methyltransferase
VEINDLVGELIKSANDETRVLDATSLPNRRNTKARYQSESKSLERLREKYGHVFRNGRVLDFSCGAGRASRIAATLGAREIWVADITYSPVRYCLDVLRKAFPSTTFHGVVAASDSMPFEEDFFDAILIYGSLHHYPNMAEFLERCSKISHHVFILAEPASLGFWQKAIDKFGFSTEYGDAHTDRVDEKELTGALAKCGMNVESDRINQYFPKSLDFVGNFAPFYTAWFFGLRVLDKLLPREWRHSLNICARRA